MFTESDDFPFRLFNSISFCDIGKLGELLDFFAESVGDETFFSTDKTALV